MVYSEVAKTNIVSISILYSENKAALMHNNIAIVVEAF